eukprot:6260763-Pyramimonas_sp.AAC.1
MEEVAEGEEGLGRRIRRRGRRKRRRRRRGDDDEEEEEENKHDEHESLLRCLLGILLDASWRVWGASWVTRGSS